MKSPRIDRLSERAELFYRRLMSVVDDFGRFDAVPKLLRSAVYPLRIDEISSADVTGFLAECVDAGLLAVYTVNGQPYLELIDFRQHARSKESKFPAPDRHAQRECSADAPQEDREGSADEVPRARRGPARTRIDGDGDGDGDGDERDRAPSPPEADPKPRPPASRGARIPDDFPHDEALAFCRTERPDLDPQRVRDKFRDYWLGVPGLRGCKADWLATWRNFVRSEHAPRSLNGHGPPGRPRTRLESAAASFMGLNRPPPRDPNVIDITPSNPASERLG